LIFFISIVVAYEEEEEEHDPLDDGNGKVLRDSLKSLLLEKRIVHPLTNCDELFK